MGEQSDFEPSSQAKCLKFKGRIRTPTLFPHLKVFLFLLFPAWCRSGVSRSSTLSGWTACSSRMLLVLGRRPGFLHTPTTPFHQPGIPAAINQSGDSPWMSVNMFPSLPLSSSTFLSHFLCFQSPDSVSLFFRGLANRSMRDREAHRSRK